MLKAGTLIFYAQFSEDKHMTVIITRSLHQLVINCFLFLHLENRKGSEQDQSQSNGTSKVGPTLGQAKIGHISKV